MQRNEKKSVVLVLGGVRSGKSRYAQQLAERFDRVTFVATAERREDVEMVEKIDRHRAERPAHWSTIEEPLLLAEAMERAGREGDVVLIDCLTIFAANLLEAHGQEPLKQRSAIDALCTMVGAATGSVILVSNEVGSGVVPAYASGRRFRDLVGEINQRVAAASDTVLWMVAGLPLVLKGALPGEAAR